ncbi:MAG: hypothetical protein ABRQ39_27205 [Candidatus Eremiobacterota bacterium]
MTYTDEILIKAGKSAKKILGHPQGITGGKAGSRTCGTAMKAVMNIAEERQEQAYTGSTGYSIIILKELLGFSTNVPLNTDEIPIVKDLISCFNSKKSFIEIKKQITYLIMVTENTERHFRILSENPDSVTMVKERDNICRLLGTYKKCLKEMNLEMPVEKNLYILADISKNIFLSIIHLIETEQILYYNHCITCGYGNNPERKYCKSCQSPIQRCAEYVNPVNRSFLEEEAHNSPCSMLTGNIRAIIRETGKLQKGKKTPEVFIKEIEDFIELLSSEKSLIEIMEDTGTDLILKGLNILKEASVKNRHVNLAEGINLIIEGANKLYYLQKGGEEAERSMLKKRTVRK